MTALTPTVLRRSSPATRWLEALPLGNGRLGAMVWGDPRAARFSLNDATLWSGGFSEGRRRPLAAEDAARAREEARALLRAGDAAAAGTRLAVLGDAWCQAFQPVGDLIVTVDGDTGPAERSLDLDRGVHVVAAADGEHRTLVSRADEVLVHALPLAPGAALAVDLETPQLVEQRVERPDGLDLLLRVPSDVPPTHAPGGPPVRREDPAMRAAVAVRHRREGDRALVVCAVVTSWRGLGERPDRPTEEVLAAAARQAEAALARGEHALRERHAAHPAPCAEAFSLALDGPPAAELLSDVVAYGRYLLAAASRPGLPPANLQGLWNAQVQPPWSSNFTANINLEMNHWAAGVAQVPEAAAALDAFVALLRRTGRDTARRLYGADGWTVHHNVDAWGHAEPVDGDARWALWPMGGLWLEQQLDDLARFTGEEPARIAAHRFPAWREAAAFALDLLAEDAAGEHLVTFPSTSPENRFLTADGEGAALDEGTAMDRWLVRHALTALLDAAERTDRQDDPVVRRAAAALPRVAGPRIGPDGRLLEWSTPRTEEEPTHRHVSHLAPVFPGAEPLEEDVERAAARSLETRGDEATGWSLAWKACLWARLRDPARVQTLLEMFLRPAETLEGERSGLYPNLFSAHPPFQMDANFGIVAAVAECLLQSHRGEIEILPTVPALLASGRVRGLVARPGVAVDLDWADGVPTSLVLRAVGPAGAGEHVLRHGDRRLRVTVPATGELVVDPGALAAPVGPRTGAE